MQHKLLAAAVLSAFSGVAAAQSANVTLYGTLLGDFQFASANGADASAAPAAPTSSTRSAYTTSPANQATRTRTNPSGSNFGIRGTEDLGNGLQAWFQLELSASLGNPTATAAGANHGNAPTYRNSAVGLRSSTWGSVSIGMWDTPFNVAAYSTMNANGRTGVASTNVTSNMLGALGAIGAGGAWSGQNENAACLADTGVTAASCLNAGTNFDRRQKGILQWWSPNWSGFEGRVAYSAVQLSDGVTASNRAAGSIKPNIWDVSLAYNNGPLALGYAYERQNDLLAYTAAVTTVAGGLTNGIGSGLWQITGTNVSGSRATGHRLGGKYAFDLGGGSSIGVGAMWERLNWDVSYATTIAGDLTQIKHTGWRLQGNFTTGNHFFGLEYAKSNKLDGSITSTTAINRSFDGSGSDVKAWILTYNYAFSKRTSMTAYYTAINNGTNASSSGLVFSGIATATGADPKYYGVNLRHTF
jgi:predicted porin